MKKITAASLLAGAINLAIPLLACAASQQLNVPLVTQEHSEWCWDADAKAVLDYRGVSASQCDIANWVNGVNYACGQSGFYWNDYANSPNYMTGSTGISGILWAYGGRHWSYFNSPVSYSTATYAIDNGNPIVILWQWPNGGGHFVVVDGYNNDNGQMLYFMNPWPGEGAGYGDYNWMRYGSGDMGTHSWAESLITY